MLEAGIGTPKTAAWIARGGQLCTEGRQCPVGRCDWVWFREQSRGAFRGVPHLAKGLLSNVIRHS